MNQILLVIVLYKCALKDSHSYRSLLSRYDALSIFVYDNSPFSQQIKRDRAEYVHAPENQGLSVAYNAACKYAKENGYDWMLLLDQDTDFSNISLDDYINAINANEDVKMIAPKVRAGNKYMSPIKVWHHIAVLQESVPSGMIPLRKYIPINSGMCVNIKAMMKCGGYNEDVFLDYSDHEFVRRFRKHYPTAYILDKEIHQNFSVVSDDKNLSINRYKLYCKSIRACERSGHSDNFWYFILVLKRGLSICFRKRTILPLKIFFWKYLFL